MWKLILSLFGLILLVGGVLLLHSYLVEENRQADYEKALAVLGNATSGKLISGYTEKRRGVSTRRIDVEL